MWSPWKTHWALVKGIREPHEVKKNSFDLGGNRTHDLRIRSTVTLPTELRGQTEKVVSRCHITKNSLESLNFIAFTNFRRAFKILWQRVASLVNVYMFICKSKKNMQSSKRPRYEFNPKVLRRTLKGIPLKLSYYQTFFETLAWLAFMTWTLKNAIKNGVTMLLYTSAGF